ncbi:unnamed protein product [Oncorhynchus mykiss]|uniref:Calpain catalytic domain-containing protein n=1 Tax=Oncorhynchus mykiss TaxID=8022 RepID=A0A060Z445_ONCMY|nr:unnamed protein product [Oncorhynchus mykiss]
MEDFTGGIAYSLPVSSRTPRVMWKALSAALSRGSLLSCFIQVHRHTQERMHTHIAKNAFTRSQTNHTHTHGTCMTYRLYDECCTNIATYSGAKKKFKSRKSHCMIFNEFICKLWWKISIWSPTNKQDFYL